MTRCHSFRVLEQSQILLAIRLLPFTGFWTTHECPVSQWFTSDQICCAVCLVWMVVFPLPFCIAVGPGACMKMFKPQMDFVGYTEVLADCMRCVVCLLYCYLCCCALHDVSIPLPLAATSVLSSSVFHGLDIYLIQLMYVLISSCLTFLLFVR